MSNSTVQDDLDIDYGPLYAARKKVYPQKVSGTFRRIKWALMGVCLGVYYFLLFVLNSIGGRIWCGYLCPQTVWTDLFYAVERLIEGDRRERMKKDAAGWNLERVSETVLKHSIW